MLALRSTSLVTIFRSRIGPAAIAAAALAAGCGSELPSQPSTGEGGAAGGQTSTSTTSTGSATTSTTTTSTTTTTGAGGAPPGAWWKHLMAPDGSSSWMTVPGAMTVDSHGNVVITGRANGPVAFEAPPTELGAAPRCLFVAKYDAEGTLSWARQFGTALPYSKITGVVAGADDSIVITGHFQGGPLNLGGADLVSAGGTDLFVAKLDANGEHVWSLRAGGASYDFGGRAALAPDGGVVAAGGIGSHLGVLWISPAGELVLQKVSPGSVSINESFAGPVSGVAIDAAGNAVVSGTFGGGGTDFGGGPTPAPGFEAGFVASYAAAGAGGGLRWLRTFPTMTGNPVVNSGVRTRGLLASGDALIVTGDFPKTIDLGGGYGAPLDGSSGFVAAIAAADGAPRWSYALGAGSAVIGMTRGPAGPALSAVWTGAANIAGTSVPGDGLHLVTIAPGNGSLAAARAVSEVGDVKSNSQDLQPISVAPDGELAIGFGFLGGLDMPIATIQKGEMSLEDMLLVHLPK